MNYQTILLIMISLSVFIDLIFVLLRFHQYKKEPLKEVFEIFTKEAYQKVISYHQKLNVFNLTKFVFKSIILFLIIYFHVMYSIYTYLNEQVTIEPFNSELFILIIFTLLFLGIEIVFDSYKTFKLNQEYGFNKLTKKVFVQSKLMLVLMILAAAIALYQYLTTQNVYEQYGILFTAITLIIVSPKLFNRLKPLPESHLKEKLTAFAEKYNFKMKQVYISPASRKTTKVNASFSGFGPIKKIVFFDTLIQSMTEEEVLGVFAHEMGHYKHKDFFRLYFLGLPVLFVIFLILNSAINSTRLYSSFYMPQGSVLTMILFVYSCFYIGKLFFKLITYYFIRKIEYEADQFEVKHVGKEVAINVLKKLAQLNYSDLNPHPVDVMFNYSHPSILERIDAIKKTEL